MTLANWLTFVRLLLSPVFVLVFLQEGLWARFTALADSISRMSIFIAFMAVGLIPWWMVLIFVYRDSLISTMRTVCAYRGQVVAARASGKIKAIIQATVILIILAARLVSPLFPQFLSDELLRQGAWWLVLIAALYTQYSLFEYLAANWAIVAAASRFNPKDRTA